MAGPAKKRAQLEQKVACDDDVLSDVATRASSPPKTSQPDRKTADTPKITPPSLPKNDTDYELYHSMFGIEKNEVPDTPPVMFNTPLNKDEPDEADDWVITPTKESMKKSHPLLTLTPLRFSKNNSAAPATESTRKTSTVSSPTQPARVPIVKDFEEIEELGLTNDTSSSSSYDSDEAEGMFLVPSKSKPKFKAVSISISKPIPKPTVPTSARSPNPKAHSTSPQSPTTLALAESLLATGNPGYVTASAMLADQASLLALSKAEARANEEMKMKGMSAKERKEYFAQKALRKFRTDEEKRFGVLRKEDSMDQRLFAMDEDAGRDGKGFWVEEGDGESGEDREGEDEDEEKGGLAILEKERMK